MQLYLLIGLGGALGSMLRYFLNGVISNRLGETFPWGTLAINVTGSFVIGVIATLTGTGGRWFASPETRFFLMTGICGGYTTFSSFSLQTLNLALGGEWLGAGMNILLSVVLCLLGVWAGHGLALWINGLEGA